MDVWAPIGDPLSPSLRPSPRITDAPQSVVLGQRPRNPIPTDHRSDRLLVLPKAFETLRREFSISNGVLNIFVPKIMLEGSRIVSVVRELVSACVPQHVRMHREWKLTLLSYTSKRLAKSRRGHRRLSLG